MFEEVISALARPLDPLPTDAESRLSPMPDVRAVVFDVYGTLLVSGSGDVGVAAAASKPEAAAEALEAAGVPTEDGIGQRAVDALLRHIAAEHERLRGEGVDFPEVRIDEIWSRVLDEILSVNKYAASKVAIEYEMRVNPVAAMPGLDETLTTIGERGLQLGIVSNAQAFTPALFGPLTGRSAADWGFADDLCVWSYAHRRAKPGTFLYEQMAERLAAYDITPAHTLYVGNDMRNDVWPASRVGFRTALFAGDARSLRLREDDPDVAGITADVVVTDLRQLLDVLPTAGS